jgi:hypothetical protein
MYFARRRVRLSNFGGAFPSFNDAFANQSLINECLAPSLLLAATDFTPA